MKYIKEHPRHYNNLEIEAKLGRFEFKGNAVKNFEKINEIFILPDFSHNPNHENKFNFVAGVLPKDFYLIWAALEKESKLNGANIEYIKPIIYKDTTYSGNKRKSQEFHDGKLVKEEIIRKENKKHINVRNEGYDFRITCSEEMPTDIDEENDKMENIREKYRNREKKIQNKNIIKKEYERNKERQKLNEKIINKSMEEPYKGFFKESIRNKYKRKKFN